MRYVSKQIARVALTVAAIPIGLSFHSPPTVAAQEQTSVSPAATQSVHASKHSGELGVMVSSSPGKGVHVVGVIPGSPAAKAGIRPITQGSMSVSNPCRCFIGGGFCREQSRVGGNQRSTLVCDVHQWWRFNQE